MSGEQVEYWDAAAACFDDAPDHGLRDPETRAAWDALLRAALPTPPAELADLGCGTGTLSVLAAAQGHRVSGLETVLGMLGRHDRAATLVTLRDPLLWGGPADDERYLIVSGPE